MDKQNNSVVTEADIETAAIRWCGDKDRETFLGDIDYFKHNWRALPGLRKYVEEAARHRLTSQPAQSDPVAIVAGKRLTIKPGAPEIALLCRAIFRSTFADDEDDAVVNAKYGEWPEDQAKAIRAAKFVLRALGGDGAVVRALTHPTTDTQSDVVREAVLAERERCAKLAESLRNVGFGVPNVREAGQKLAAAIRKG